MDQEQKDLQQEDLQQRSPSGESLQNKKTLYLKRGLRLLLILMIVLVISGMIGAFLLLGKRQDHPLPVIGGTHFKVMNTLLRQYRKELRRRKKQKGFPAGRFTLRFNHQEVNALLDIARFYAKPIENFSWSAHVRKEGVAVICFSRPLAGKIALNGEVHIVPSFKEGRLQLKSVYFRLGRCVLDPSRLQGKLDLAVEKILKQKKYQNLLGYAHSMEFHSGDLILVLKDSALSGIPLMSF